MATDVIGRTRIRGVPDPSWDEVVALVAHFKRNGLRPWMDARLFAFVATVVLGQLRLIEALSLKVSDVQFADRVIVVSRRTVPGTRRYPARIGFGSVLGAILGRWVPRAGGEWLFPNQTRSGPWDAFTSRNDRATKRLAEACDGAGLRPLGVEALRIFGKVPGRLVEPSESPFVLADDELTLQFATIDEMRARVIGLYPSKKQHTSKSNAKLVFDEFERMGLKDSSEIIAPGFVARFASSAGVTDIRRGAGGFLIAHLQTVCGKLVDLGQLDASPFIGLPGFMEKARLPRSMRQPARFKLARTRRKATFDRLELDKLSDQQRELVLLINSQEPDGASGPWIETAFRLSSYRYHLKNIAKLGEYWRSRIDFPVNPGDVYHVRTN